MKQLYIGKKVTNRKDAGLDKYLHDIVKFQLKRIKEGDEDALHELVRANLRFVVSVAKQYQGKGLSLIDLINEGNIGLIRAAKRFDATKGFKFISYAVWWIRQSIMQSLTEYARVIRLPLNKVGSINKVNRVFSELLQKYGRKPTDIEIAKELEIAPDDVRNAMLNSVMPVSLDAPVTEGEKMSLHDLMKDPNGTVTDLKLQKESLIEEINRVLSTLNPREAEVIRMYYGINKNRSVNLDEIANEFGLTRERVRQIKGRAIQLLKNRSKILRKYL